jgi:hypothetical protein
VTVADVRAQWLLGIAGVLAVARLVVVPWVAAQNEQRQQLEVLTQRLDRSEGVTGNSEAILAARDALAKDAEAAFGVFPSAADDDPRLSAQRRLTDLATRAGLTVTLFDWLVDGEVAEAGLAYSRASLRLEGPLDKLILMHGALEGSMPFVAVREFQVKARTAVAGPSPAAISANLVLDVFFRPATEAPPPADSPEPPADPQQAPK